MLEPIWKERLLAKGKEHKKEHNYRIRKPRVLATAALFALFTLLTKVEWAKDEF